MREFLLMAMLMAGSGVMGDWVGPTGSVVRIAPCGSEVCLKIVKLPAKTPTTTDTHNPNVALRTRALCGLDIGTGFSQTEEGKLEGGRLYDPISGKSYKGTIAAEGDVMKLRGFVGVSLFGRSETWKRVGRVEACK